MEFKEECKPEVWSGIVRASTRMNQEQLKQYAAKLKSYFELRKNNDQTNPDMKYICHNLMRETKFAISKEQFMRTRIDNPQTVTVKGVNKSMTMYALKKHLAETPEYNDIVLSKLKRYEFENLKNSKYADSVMNSRHSAYEFGPPLTLPIESSNQVKDYEKEVHQNLEK